MYVLANIVKVVYLVEIYLAAAAAAVPSSGRIAYIN